MLGLFSKGYNRHDCRLLPDTFGALCRMRVFSGWSGHLHLWNKLKQSVDVRIGHETTLRDLPQVMVEAWEGIAQVRIQVGTFFF